MLMIILSLSILSCLSIVESSHCYGGTITWMPFTIFLVQLSTTTIAPVTDPNMSTESEMSTTFDIITDTTTSTSTESTTTTSTTSSTSSSTTSTSTTSTTSSTSSTTSSTATTSTTSSSSTSTSTTSKTTSTSATTTTTTTTAQESITVTVLVPVSSKDDLLALGLALGLPLLLLLAGLTAYGFCRDKCMSFSDLYRRLFKPTESSDNQVKPNENFSDYKDDSENFQGDFRDYRQEYIKDGNDDQPNNHSILINEEGSLTKENSFACMSISDFELNPLNVTTTSFFSPSNNSLPNDDVQHITETSSKTIKSKPKGSVLARAYSEQEKNRPENTQ